MMKSNSGRTLNRLACCTCAVVVAGLLAAAPHAHAGMTDISFDYAGADLVYTASSGALTVSSDTAFIDHNSGGLAIDRANAFDLLGSPGMKMTLNVSGSGASKGDITGIFEAYDTAGLAFKAYFKSASASIITGVSGPILQIAGALSGIGGDSILQGIGAGDIWTYTGTDIFTSGPDADGTDGTISISQASSYERGTLFVFDFSLGTNPPFGNIVEYFEYDRIETGGNVKGAIVPAPASIVLVGIGIMASRRLRRRYAR